MGEQMIKLVILMFFSLCLTACGHSEAPKNAGSKEQKTYTVVKKPLITTLNYSEYIRPIRSAAVVSPSDGRIMAANIHYGEYVEKGDILLKVSAIKLEEEYANAVTAYLKAKDDFAGNQIKFSGTTELWKLGLIPRNDYISQKSNLDSSRVSLLQATKKLESILKDIGIDEAAKEIEKLDITKEQAVKQALLREFASLEVKAEFSGILLEPPKSSSGDGDSNSNAKASFSVGSELKKGQVVALIGDLSGISLQIKISEIDLDKIKPGQDAIITGIAFPNIELKGKVRSVVFQSTSTGGSVGGLPTFPATIKVDSLTPQQKKLIRVGMSATAAIKVETPGQLMIPIDAVSLKKGQSIVQRIEGDKIVEVPVTTGETTYNDVVVLTGLKEGDKIVYTEKDIVIVNH